MSKPYVHAITFFLLKPWFKLVFKLKYRYKPQPFHKTYDYQGPKLILANHAMAIDPISLTLSFKKHIYFVASDIIFSMGFISKVISFLAAPIPKSKSRSDSQTIRMIYKRIKSGHNVGIFPEGNSTFSGETMPMNPAIAKLVKRLNVPVVFYQIQGGSITKPRFAKRARKGRLEGRILSVWEPKEFQDLAVSEIRKHIESTLYYNDVEAQSALKIPYKGKAKAEDIESTFYLCPKCESFHTLHSHKDTISCQACDLTMSINHYGLLEGAPTHAKDTVHWYRYQRQVTQDYLTQQPASLSHTIDVAASFLIEKGKKKIKTGPATLTLTHNHLQVKNERGNQVYEIKHLVAAVQQKNKLIVYHQHDPQAMYFVGDDKLNALFIAQCIDIINGKEGY